MWLWSRTGQKDRTGTGPIKFSQSTWTPRPVWYDWGPELCHIYVRSISSTILKVVTMILSQGQGLNIVTIVISWAIHKILHPEIIKVFKPSWRHFLCWRTFFTRLYNFLVDNHAGQVRSYPIPGIRLIPSDLFLSLLHHLLISSGSVTLDSGEDGYQLVSRGAPHLILPTLTFRGYGCD